ncbi:MAG: N-acetylmuramoyl-L-alanine amidase [Candidatus Krumholzibacteriia bacterium]
MIDPGNDVIRRACTALLVTLLVAAVPAAPAHAADRHAEAAALAAESPLDLLQRHGLDRRHLRAFTLLNGIADARGPLIAGKLYRLPAFVVPFDGERVQTSLELPMTEAIDVRDHNAWLARAGLKPPITDDHAIWVPYDHVLARAEAGQSVADLLGRYALDGRQLSAFAQLNGLPRPDGTAALAAGRLYRLPVHIRPYAGPTIRQALSVSAESAWRIGAYNRTLADRGLKPQPWDDHVVWVPYELHENPAFGRYYAQYEQVSDELRDCVFYLSPGHGGPDPGTSANREGERICEDEYAYDIALRLGRELARHGARVEMVLADEGIRDTKFLTCDRDERFSDGTRISADQATRLQQRVDLVNRIDAGLDPSMTHRRFLAIHIDFRADRDRRVDFDLYHHASSEAGRRLAAILQATIERHYDARLGGRNFVGRIVGQTEDADFYVIRETRMPAVLLELANINNELDQLKFIVIDSRQRIAEWLCEGLIADRERAAR